MKMKLTLVLLLVVCGRVAFAQSEFKMAWKDPQSSIIIDAFDQNELDFDKMMTDPKFMGLIHKVTEGVNTIDDKYEERKKICAQHKLLFGAYHLGRSSDPIQQAEFFIDKVGEGTDILLVLNLEKSSDDIMSLENAEKFITHVHDRVGKYPAIMVNNVILKDIINKYDEKSVFAHCLLIYERLLNELPVKELQNKIWNRYFLWQFCTALNCKEGEKCLYNLPGTKHNIDVNVFAHDRKVLEYVWMANEYNDNLEYKVQDLAGYFPMKVYCAEGKEVSNVKYVEVSDKTTGEIVDRYLSYNVDGKMLVTRQVFQYAATEMDLYARDDVKTIKSPNRQLAKMSVIVDDKTKNMMISYDTFDEPNKKSPQQIKDKVGDMAERMSQPYVTSVQLTDVKFECD